MLMYELVGQKLTNYIVEFFLVKKDCDEPMLIADCPIRLAEARHMLADCESAVGNSDCHCDCVS